MSGWSGGGGSRAEDLAEVAAEVERQRRLALEAAVEADERRRRAAAHAGGALDPRAQGLWAAAAYFAARAREADARLRAAEAISDALRARAGEAARRAAAIDVTPWCA